MAKRNVQDATLKNTRLLWKSVVALKRQVQRQDQWLAGIRREINSLRSRLKKASF